MRHIKTFCTQIDGIIYTICTIVVEGQLQLTYQQVKKKFIRIISRKKPGMHPLIHPILSYASGIICIMPEEDATDQLNIMIH